MSRLAGVVTRTAVGALCFSLLGVGLVTAGLLHLRAMRGRDQLLLAAAYAEAHPWQDERFGNDYVRSPVQVRPWTKGDPRVSAALANDAMHQERPVWRTLEGRRVLLLVVEPTEAEDREGEDHAHFLVVAEAPAVSVWDAALPFLGTYLLVSLAAAAAAGLVIQRGMQRALQPIEFGALGLEAVQGLGSKARVPMTGAVEVDRLLASANALLDRLDVAFDAQSSFTAQAAHELRTPITILVGELELALRRERTVADYQKAIGESRVQAQRLQALVDGLMVLARVESGQADRGRTVEHLSEVVHQALRREGAALREAGCAVSVSMAHDPEVSMHVPLVAVAVANLLRNAARYAPGAPVKVEVDAEDGVPWVRVSDGGPGLSEAQCAEVMDRFARADTRRDGLGLGLTMAREIARRHGGDVTLRPAAAGGVVATLRLG